MSFEKTLEGARFETQRPSKHPFYLIQVTDRKELELDGHLVSDALATLLSKEPYTHVFLQTHGWQTPPDKAVKIPFSEFMAGMQDDRSVPNDEAYKPLYIALTWESVPFTFLREKDALTRAEILGADAELQKNDPISANAMAATARVARGAPVDELKKPVYELAIAQNAPDPDVVVDNCVSRCAAPAEEAKPEHVETAPEEPAAKAVGWLPRILRGFLEPIEHLVFGRLIARGTATGSVLHGILAKLMSARRAKFCLMGNSLGVHVLCGALRARGGLPFKAHTVFLVQGAVEQDWFAKKDKYADMLEQVAGPVVCTTSDKDTVLSILFESLNDFSLGRKGFPDGRRMKMREREALRDEPYEWELGRWNTIDGSEFIDEGSGIAGGHGDFKEDETTMTYWSAINMEIDESLYDFGKVKTKPASLWS